MKISELKRIAEENDYELTETDIYYKLTHKYYDNNITINRLCKNRLWITISFHCDERDFNMIKAAVELAETPLEDRKEEKKFYLKHRWMRTINGLSRVLKIDIEDGTADVGYISTSFGYKNQFTLQEIEEIKKKFDTDLAEFEEVEVEDE